MSTRVAVHASHIQEPWPPAVVATDKARRRLWTSSLGLIMPFREESGSYGVDFAYRDAETAGRCCPEGYGSLDGILKRARITMRQARSRPSARLRLPYRVVAHLRVAAPALIVSPQLCIRPMHKKYDISPALSYPVHPSALARTTTHV